MEERSFREQHCPSYFPQQGSPVPIDSNFEFGFVYQTGNFLKSISSSLLLIVILLLHSSLLKLASAHKVII